MERKIRKKKCIICDGSFTPFKTTQRVCSPKCAMEFGKRKVKNDKVGLQSYKEERKSKNEMQILHQSTTNIVHAYVRERDKGLPCISCGTPWRNTFEAGHCFPKKGYHGIRYDLFNIHGQCGECNRHKEGNYAEYHLRMPARIGAEEWAWLQHRARMCKRFPHKFTKHELKEIQKRIKEKRKGLLF